MYVLLLFIRNPLTYRHETFHKYFTLQIIKIYGEIRQIEEEQFSLYFMSFFCDSILTFFRENSSNWRRTALLQFFMNFNVIFKRINFDFFSWKFVKLKNCTSLLESKQIFTNFSSFLRYEQFWTFSKNSSNWRRTALLC